MVAAVLAITRGLGFRNERRLVEQLNDAADSVIANIAEGFAQSSDRSFARCLDIAKGSCNEIRSHLAVAVIRRCTTEADVQSLMKEADEISRMLTGFTRYLLRCDRKF